MIYRLKHIPVHERSRREKRVPGLVKESPRNEADPERPQKHKNNPYYRPMGPRGFWSVKAPDY